MAPSRRRLLAAIGASAALAGCLGGDDGGGGDGDDTTTTSGATDTTTGMETPTDGETTTGTDTATGMGDPTVRVRTHPDLGDHLVGPDGLTLYMFDQDTQGGSESACTDGCASAWPPLVPEGAATAGDGVTASLTAFERASGERQAAANGWPLYYYAQDGAPGDVSGQGVGGVWWVLRPDGTPVRASSTTTEPETTTSGVGY